MVSDGCGDCARRLPQITKAQTKMQTKRTMTLNLRESMLGMLLLPWKPQSAALVGRCPGSGYLGWNAQGKSFLRDLSWVESRASPPVPPPYTHHAITVRVYGAVGCALRSASSSVWLLGTFWSTSRQPSS